MLITHKQTEAERHRDYRRQMGDTGRERDAARKRTARADRIPSFIGVDSEGIGKGKNHRVVLVSAYDKHGNGDYRIARDVSIGLQWPEVFDFLYAQFEKQPESTFSGFYLGYDFNNWLSYKARFPVNAATSLLTKRGIAARKIKGPQTRRSMEHPVRVGRWEVKVLGLKRLSIRPRPEGCNCYEEAQKCPHEHLPWMHICDAGAFYQQSFLSLLKPSNWSQDPDGWPVTQEEYDKILEGKNKRSDAALDDDMLVYNRLENIVLARIMERLAKGFKAIDITLAKDLWYGPGASASKWLKQQGIPKDKELQKLMPKWFRERCHYAYFGGWFEIFSHGKIRGQSYNYDINNAYPYAASKLPHICGDCQFKRGSGEYQGNSDYLLLYATVFTKGTRIGAVPYRDKHGNILRPSVSKGWYWQFEIEAARRAGLVKKVMTHEWAEFIPCSHPKPLTKIADLYYLRLKTGKSGAQGMAIKLNNNSVYGKFAQSVGNHPYNNWFYASYITAHCRTQILDSIASHPGGADSVLMVATDGICFDSPHPTLEISKKLGAWEASNYTDLVLFKPGVYWHKEGKQALLEVKSRGVPREEFAKACEEVEGQFLLFSHFIGMGRDLFRQEYEEIAPGLADVMALDNWPWFMVPVKFRMKTCKQALNEGKWETSAEVQEDMELRQDSNPRIKRRKVSWNFEKGRLDSDIHDPEISQLQTFYHGQTEQPKPMHIGFTFDGETAWGPILEAAGALRNAPANYNLPLNPDYEWTNVWGGDN